MKSKKTKLPKHGREYRDVFDPLSKEEWDILLSLVSKKEEEKNKIYEYFTSRTNGLGNSYFIVKNGDDYYHFHYEVEKFDFEDLKLYFELEWHLNYCFLVNGYSGRREPLKVSNSYIFDLIKKLTCPLGMHHNYLLNWCGFHYYIKDAVEYLIKDDSVLRGLDPDIYNINDIFNKFKKIFLTNPNVSNYLVSKKSPIAIRIVEKIMEKPLPEYLKREDIDRFMGVVKTLGIIPVIKKEEFVKYVKTGNLPMVKLALENKTKLLESDSYLLFDAAQKGYTEIVELLLQNPKIDVNYKDCKSLIYAAYYDYVDIVKALLSRPEIEFDHQKTLKYADDESKKIIEKYLKNNQKGTTNS
jgi:hypothetical protein